MVHSENYSTIDIPGELWLPVPGYKHYLVSNHGRVKSFSSRSMGKILRQGKNTKGYCMAYLYSMEMDKRLSIQVHRLVAKVFIGEPNGLQVNHKDGNKLNNCLENLEYATGLENIRHAIKTGLRSATINLVRGNYFTGEQIKDIWYLINNGWENHRIARMYHCHHSTISKIRTGANYKAA